MSELHAIMVDPTPGTEATKVLHSSGSTAPANTLRPFVDSHCKLKAGDRWHGYQIDGPVPGGVSHAFEATNVGQMEKVLITASLITKSTVSRRAVWEQLHTQLPPEARILKCIEAHEEDGWRYEVTNEPPATTLREWIACHKAESWAQRQVLEQLTAALSSLHSIGIVHLGIRPETVYLTGEAHRMEIVLGGLNTAILYKRADSAVAAVDPFYAPPEAVDSDGRQPGIGLCASDWWSVGRIIQEMVLGRHVMGMLFGCDVILNPAPEVCDRAKALLLELEPPGLRAGAVEAMPELDPPMKVMLRGLLTSARDARWSGEAVRLWLAKENVSNHYDLARNARFFTWKGRGRTLSEAAQFFRAEENWADGEQNIFELTNPETLAHFVSTMPAYSVEWKRLQEIQGYVKSPDWSGIPEAAGRSVAAALAWMILGPQPGALVVKGRRIDAAGLTELLSSNQDFCNYEIVKALMSAPCRTLIAELDAAAAETLAHAEAVGGEALRRAEQNRWIDAGDHASLAYVLKLSFETEQALRKRVDRVRTTYASCQDAGLAAILADKNSAPWATVLLVVTAENPRRFGYVTRTEHARQHLVGLQLRSDQLRAALFWLRLKGVLMAGRPWSGSWSMFSIFWLCLVAFGIVVARDVATTACFALGLMGLRFILGRQIRVLVAGVDPAAGRWNWRDGPERCTVEAQRSLSETNEPSFSRVMRQLDETVAAMGALRTNPPQGQTQAMPRLTGLWLVFFAAIILSLVGSVELLKNFGRNFGTELFSVAWSKPASTNLPSDPDHFSADTPEQIEALLKTLPSLDPEMVEKVKRGEYEIVKEGFGYALQGPIKKWNFTPPAVVPPLPVESRAPATSAQRAFALVSGELLLRPYGQKGVSALVVVRVPTPTGLALMVYNGRARKLMDNTALLLREGLADNNWYRFERYNVIYLGAPSQMDVERQSLISQNENQAVNEVR